MNFTTVANPRHFSANTDAILLDVVFPHLGPTPVPFAAMPSDSEPHGRELFLRASRGDYGPIAPFVPPPPPPPAVPERVSAYQARMTLRAAGHLQAVLTHRATLPADDPFAIAWDTGADVYRSSPLTAAMATFLGLTAAQVDALFISAAGVT